MWIGPGPRSAPVARGGEFRYIADAARFTDCLSGRDYPVAMELDYVAAERAYLATVEQPGLPTDLSSLLDLPEGLERHDVATVGRGHPDGLLCLGAGNRCGESRHDDRECRCRATSPVNDPHQHSHPFSKKV